MKEIIILTEVDSGKNYIFVDKIVNFFVYNGTTLVQTVYGQAIPVKETPEEIINLLMKPRNHK